MPKRQARTLAQQKAELERLLKKQNTTIARAFNVLETKGAAVDERVNKITRYKKPLMLITSFLFLRQIRKPGKTLRTVRHGWRLFSLRRWWRKF